MKLVILHLKRDHYRSERTLGKLYDAAGLLFCYVLEDTVRAYGIKDKTNTAIPHNEGDSSYFVRVMESPKYGKVATIFTENGAKPILNNGGIEFSYIRCHGGNTEKDTEGCLLVNEHRDVDTMKAWGSMKTKFAEYVEKLTNDGYDVRLRITNLPQKS